MECECVMCIVSTDGWNSVVFIFCIIFMYIQYADIFHWFIVSLLQKVIKCMFSFQPVASIRVIIKGLHFIFLCSGP